MSPKEKSKSIARAIELAIDSLESHLPYVHTNPKTNLAANGNKQFHINCVKEYAELIKILSNLF